MSNHFKFATRPKGLFITFSTFTFVLFFAAIFTFSACKKDTCKTAPDVSASDIAIKIERFDQDLFSLDTTKMAESIAGLYKKYPEFAEFYFQILGFKDAGNEMSEGFYKNISGYINFPQVQGVYDTTQLVYGDISDIESELSQAFKYMKHYLPKKNTPKIIAMYSEFTNPTMIPPFDDMYVVSLEYFFGENYPIYYTLPQPTPYYIAQTLNREHITSKILKAVAEDFIPDTASTTLLDHMILNGKRLYLVDKLLPCTPDYIKLECTEAQAEWMKNSEVPMWSEVFVNQLYGISYKDFQKYIGPSPSSPNMPEEAPGNTGSYIGWKIVEQFMERNPNINMEQLFAMTDAQAILKASKFKPKK